MDSVDRTLLNILQYDFPLSITPFAEIAGRIGVNERDVLDRIARLKAENIIRRISPIFDSRKIGYASTLAAFMVDPNHIDDVADFVNQHPGVSHNYQRKHAYNLWFTLTVRKDVDIKRSINHLAAKAGVQHSLYLPSIRNFKISFRLDMQNADLDNPNSIDDPQVTYHCDNEPALRIDPHFIRLVQRDMPLVTHPFADIAGQLKCTQNAIAEQLRTYLQQGYIRRIASVLTPVHAGYPHNIMVAWNIDRQHTEAFGHAAAQIRQVSHCYERPSYPQWPYSLYTMLHGQSEEQCTALIRRMESAPGAVSYLTLPTLREFKKVRVRYFCEDQTT
ncbi:MAG: AsnC family transcriptional regulator [Chitinivibrionales bacterium]|nr:AsnC family transcriptional regulator [Chitinivibrionales bacterium]